MVEHRLPKPGVEGSNPFSRSRRNTGTLREFPWECFFVFVPLQITPTHLILTGMFCDRIGFLGLRLRG